MATETVLITGASSGIGWELAKLFAADGASLVLVARREAELRKLADDLAKQFGTKSRIIAKDLSQPSAPAEIVDELAKEGIVVDVLANNAGFGDLQPFLDQEPQRQLDMLQVNIVALTRLTRLLLPGMLDRRRGGVLNVGSVAGFVPGPGWSIYSATKAYVVSFTEALAGEVHGRGVTITCLAPGATETGFAHEAKADSLSVFRHAMSAAKVARIGHRGFRNGKLLVVTGFFNQFSVFMLRFLPRSLPRRVFAMVMKK